MFVTKEYEKLRFTDDFLFCKIMTSDLELCREVLELILGIPIKEVRLPESQKGIKLTPDGKGVRLDVYVNDGNDTVYDIEMQTIHDSNLAKRSRYYQGMIDLNLIEKGAEYNELKKSFVIFICMKRPIKNEKKDWPVYTFKSVCMEDNGIILEDETTKVFLNVSSGRKDIPPNVKRFFEYLKGKAPKDNLCKRIDNSVKKAAEHVEWRNDYMTLQMKYKEIYAEGRNDGVLEGRKEGVLEGRKEGMLEGRKEGMMAGRLEGENKLGRLILLLTKDGRVEDISKAASDDSYREKLYKEFRIE